jgi:hypothetical protein
MRGRDFLRAHSAAGMRRDPKVPWSTNRGFLAADLPSSARGLAIRGAKQRNSFANSFRRGLERGSRKNPVFA